MIKKIYQISILLVLAFFISCTTYPKEKLIKLKPSTRQEMETSPPYDYKIGPGDEIEVIIFRHGDISNKYVVPPSGILIAPLIGEVDVVGLTPSELRDVLIKRYSDGYINNAEISVLPLTIKSQKILVLGEVKNPGVIYLTSRIDIVEAIALSNGFTQDAKTSSVVLFRNENKYLKVSSHNLKNYFKRGKFEENVPLQPNDILFVPMSVGGKLSVFFSRLSQVTAPFTNVMWPLLILFNRAESSQ